MVHNKYKYGALLPLSLFTSYLFKLKMKKKLLTPEGDC